MRSVCTDEFWRRYHKLPAKLWQKADGAFTQWKADREHPGLSFKKVDDEKDIWSFRIGGHHRALCRRTDAHGETCQVWFCVGTHGE